MQPAAGDTIAVVFCIPIYDDWESARLLLDQIDAIVAEQKWQADVLFVDDGSLGSPPDWAPLTLRSVRRVDILRLRCNVGHQRAIALGLAYLHRTRLGPLVVVMDGDGEDAPQDVPKLVARVKASGDREIVFAQRARRMEGFLFRFFYAAYKVTHWLLVGRKIDIGNFSVIPPEMLVRLVGMGDLWNHYAATVIKSGLKPGKVPIARARRLRGQSKMNFVRLLSHGLSAISVYSEEMGPRFLAACAGLLLLAVGGLIALVSADLMGDRPMSGWVSTLAVGMASILVNGFLLCLAFCFLILRGRNAAGFLPLRDYSYFIRDVITIHAQR